MAFSVADCEVGAQIVAALMRLLRCSRLQNLVINTVNQSMRTPQTSQQGLCRRNDNRTCCDQGKGHDLNKYDDVIQRYADNRAYGHGATKGESGSVIQRSLNGWRVNLAIEQSQSR